MRGRNGFGLMRSLILGLAVLAAATPAFAQEARDERPRRTRIGLGPQLVPSFPGSDSYQLRPFIDVSRARGDDDFAFEAPDESAGFPLLRTNGFSVGPAIGAGLAIYFAESFLALWDPWENVSLTAASTALFEVDFGGGLGGLIPGMGLSMGHKLAILAGWTLVGLGLTWWGLQRRDA